MKPADIGCPALCTKAEPPWREVVLPERGEGVSQLPGLLYSATEMILASPEIGTTGRGLTPLLPGSNSEHQIIRWWQPCQPRAASPYAEDILICSSQSKSRHLMFLSSPGGEKMGQGTSVSHQRVSCRSLGQRTPNEAWHDIFIIPIKVNFSGFFARWLLWHRPVYSLRWSDLYNIIHWGKE